MTEPDGRESERPSCSSPAAVRVSGSVHDILGDVVPRLNPSSAGVEIRPHRIIVAWHGVLTLSFEAWPEPLSEIKRRVNAAPEFSASPENFGTRWPKLTLAARDDAAPPVTIDQLRGLTELCRGFDAELRNIGAVTLTHCSVVAFASRSLEHCLCRVDYAFGAGNGSVRNTQQRSNEEQDYDEGSYKIVQDVVRETEQLETYLSKVNAPGHRWGQHYNTVWTETTLACFLTNGDEDVETSSSTGHLLALLASFRERVDALLPGAYRWMPQQSLHLSLRALESRTNAQRCDDMER